MGGETMLKAATAFALVLSCVATTAVADMMATASNGRQVVLHGDGTWEYVLSQPIGQNLITNGSFETAPEGLGLTSGIPGWEIVRNNVDVVGAYWQQVDGRLSVDLAGTPGAGTIAQNVETIIGQTYEVSFWMAGNPACGNPSKSLRLMLGDGSRYADFTFSTQGRSLTNMGWTRQVFTFVADQPVTRLRFANWGDQQENCGAVIDGVSVVRR
jgi:choice-of-anchor C domain-containing protein